MKKFCKIGGTLVALALFFSCATQMADAKVALTTTGELKAQGITSSNMHIVSFSPDGRYLLAHAREPKNNNLRYLENVVYNIPIKSDNTIGKVKAYKIACPRIEQLAYTPDGKAVVITTKEGATFLKLDLASGKVSTIMEHVNGQPGFRCYPNVFTSTADELLIQGYFYDKDGYCGPNSIAVLDASKTGVEAFAYTADLDRAQLSTRKNYKTFAENYPAKDVGFMGMNSGHDWTCYVWNGGETTKQFDKAKEFLGLWGGANRLLYSVRRDNKNCDLIVYDGKTDKKFMLSEGRATPYMYLFLSGDGKTALFNDADDATSTTKLCYARESEGWEIKPIQGIDKKIRTGPARISFDGTKAAQHSRQGLRIVDVE